MKKIMSGVLGELEREQDYLVGDLGGIPELDNQDNIIFQYNQAKMPETRNSCTLFGSFGAVSDLLNRQFTDQEILAFNEKSYQAGRVRNAGRYVASAVDLIRKECNAMLEDKILSARLTAFSPEFWDAYNKGYTLVTSYNGDSAYNVDSADGLLNGTSFGKTYGHCVAIIKYGNIENAKVYVKDNYVGKKYNIYGLADYEALVKNGVYSRNLYIYVKEKSLTKTAEQIKAENALRLLKPVNQKINSLLEAMKTGNIVGYDISMVNDIQNNLTETINAINMIPGLK